MSLLDRLNECEGFDWDEGNSGRNREKQGVSDGECEQVFFNRPLAAPPDAQHPAEEKRIHVLGQPDAGRELFVACTLRDERIRVISARHMKKKEREFWHEHDSTEHVDWSRAERVTLPKLKPSVKSISLRMLQAMLDQLRLLANKRDVPYQSLIKLFLAERIERELE